VQTDLFNHSPNTFYNTIKLSGAELKKQELKNKSQNARILEVFTSNPNVEFTPCEVHKQIGHQGLLTSVRRAISTLAKENHLIKTEIQRKGIYGIMNNTWQLNPDKQWQKPHQQ
jgi:hypothetical protein